MINFNPTTLSISCVVYDTAYDVLAITIQSLHQALLFAEKQNVLKQYRVYLINNQSNPSVIFNQVVILARDLMHTHIEVLTGHGNIGYGRANNLAIDKTDAEFHLVLNPDVNIDQKAIAEGIGFLQHNMSVGLAAPSAYNLNGEYEYLAKRTPSPLVILLRGLNIPLLNNYFEKKLNHYIYKDKLPAVVPMPIELASGCFMLCRADVLKEVGGFSKEYFLYFEDFDLSRKISKTHQLIILPQMKIIHSGGNASRKSKKHILFFLRSALRFMLKKH